MLQTNLERSLPAMAKRPGLLRPEDVLNWILCRRNRKFTAADLAAMLARPIDQVLHALSYLTSMGALRVLRENDTWYYRLAAT